MIPDLPFYVSLLFILTVLLSFWLFHRAIRSRMLVYLSLAWLLLTGVLSYSGFFLDYARFPPHFMIAMLIPLIAILLSFVNSGGRRLIDKIPLLPLVLLSIVRIPVEIVLYLLYLNKQIPELMTFAGRNYDILAGLTVPVIYLVCFKDGQLTNRRVFLIWNIFSLALLMNIVVNAILSAPFPFQKFGFDQPNKAIFYFPYAWLPAFIVMTVLFSHLVSIRRILLRKSG
ncbi:MAG: hypothetical protein ACHQEM_00725 [Chitinophagales bacterium]